MVDVVGMARTPGKHEALSGVSRAGVTRRWLLVIAVVLIPITLGAFATVLLYVTRPQPAPTQHSASVASANSDIKGYDGSVLVLQPETAAQVRIPLGLTIEVVLEPNVGQDIVSLQTNVLTPTANPPCHVKSLCGFPGAHIWTFRAVGVGVGHLKIIFGINVCPTKGFCTITPYVYKPIVVYSRPQAS